MLSHHGRYLAGLLVLGAGFVAAATLRAQSGGGNEAPKPKFNDKGQLMRPEGYREWVYIGTPITPNDLNPPEAAFPDFHNVYIHPADFDHHRQTGQFRDGTVIIKELVSVGSKQAVSGKGYFMGEFTGLEATIKDSSPHFQFDVLHPDLPAAFSVFIHRG